MIYRYKPSEKRHEPREKKPYRRAGADSPRRLYGYRYDAIDMEALFELSKLKGKTRSGLFIERLNKISKKIFTRLECATRAVAVYVEKAFLFLRKTVSRLLSHIRECLEKRRARKRATFEISMLSGALCAVFAISLIAGGIAGYKLLFADFFGSYEKISVPSIVGREYGVALSMLDTRKMQVNVSYEYSSSIPKGTVISQMPEGGVSRKVYSDRELPEISLSVSLGKETCIMKEYVGLRARDVKLELKNAGFSVDEREEYSESVKRGTVISTYPSAGDELCVGGVAILYVSKGAKVSTVRVPNVVGYTERDAIKRITSAGFTVGEVIYKSSDEKAGVVISQSPAYNERVNKGAKISIEISAGREYNTKEIPSLYGLSLEQAKEKLAEFGLVPGTIYAAESNEPSGVVIAQSPSAGSPIDPMTVSVDMYVSS